MPFMTIEDALSNNLGSKQLATSGSLAEPEQETASFGDAFGAFVATSGIGSIFNKDPDAPTLQALRSPSPQAENYMRKAFDQGYTAEESDLFAIVQNDTEFAGLKRQVDNEKFANKLIQDAGWKGAAAGLVAGILDPINLVPGIGVSGSILKASSFAKGAKIAVGAALPSTAVSEGLSQATQATRTTEDGVINVAAGTLLAGVLGGGASALAGKLKTNQMTKQVDEVLKNPDVINEADDSFTNVYGDDSVGSARNPETIPTTLEDESIFQPKNKAQAAVFNTYTKATSGLSPIGRVLQSQIRGSKDTLQKLTETSLTLNKNVPDVEGGVGKATNVPVIAAVRAREGEYATALKRSVETFKALKKAEDGSSISKDEFNSRISAAITIADDPNPKINEAARAWSDTMIKPLEKEAQDVGLLPADLDRSTQREYLTRMFLNDKIKANQTAWKADILPYIKQMYAAETSRLKKIVKEFESQSTSKIELDDTNKALAGIFEGTQSKVTRAQYDAARERLGTTLDNRDQYIQEVADEMTSNVLRLDANTQLAHITSSIRGPLKDRTLMIPDKMVRNWIETDIEQVAHHLYRTVTPQIELKRNFDTVDFADVKQTLKEEMEALRNAAKTDEEKAAIVDNYLADSRDLEHVWNLVKGTYRSRTANGGDWVDRTASLVRDHGYLTNFGMTAVSSALDPLVLARANGASRFFKASMGLTLNKNLRQLNNDQARWAGKSINFILSNRVKSVFEIGDPFARGTALERGIHNMSGKFGNVSGLNYWNDWWEQVSALTNQMRMQETIFEFVEKGKLSVDDETYLNKNFIDAKVRKSIYDQIKEHGQFVNDTWIFNTHEWTNAKAKRTVESAINSAVSREVVIKSPGEAPILAEGTIGRTIAQGMGYAFASHRKLALANLQNADRSTLLYEMNFIVGGALLYGLKQKLKGKDIPEDNAQLFIAALENNPGLALPFVVNRYAESVGMGLSNATDSPRQASAEGFLKAAGGIPAGTAINAFRVSQLFQDNSGKQPGFQTSQGEVNSLRRMIPYQNVVGISRLYDTGERALGERLGVKYKEKKKGK